MPKPKQTPAKQTGKRLAQNAPTAKTAAHETNWVAIELAYTTTARTLDDIGAEHGVTKGRISQKAKELGWKRGAMMDRVRAKAAAKVQAQEAHVAQVQEGTEAAVEMQAVLMANTILRERRDVGRLLTIADKLATQLEQAVAEAPAPKTAKQAKSDALGEHIENLRKLGTTMSSLITLERTVLAITDATPIDPTKRVEEAIASGMDELRKRFQAKGVKV